MKAHQQPLPLCRSCHGLELPSAAGLASELLGRGVLAFLLLALGEEGRMYVLEDSALGDRDLGQVLRQLLVIAHGQLNLRARESVHQAALGDATREGLGNVAACVFVLRLACAFCVSGAFTFLPLRFGFACCAVRCAICVGRFTFHVVRLRVALCVLCFTFHPVRYALLVLCVARCVCVVRFAFTCCFPALRVATWGGGSRGGKGEPRGRGGEGVGAISPMRPSIPVPKWDTAIRVRTRTITTGKRRA